MKEEVTSTVAAWGLTFKAATDDLRDSPALAVLRRLRARGAAIRAFDPTRPDPTDGQLAGLGLELCDDPYAACEGANALVILTEWPQFAELDLEKVAAAMARPAIVDTRNLLEPAAARAAGCFYQGGAVPDAHARLRGGGLCRVHRLRPAPRSGRRGGVCRQPDHGVGRQSEAAGRAGGFSFVEADVSAAVPVAGPLDAVLNLACPASPAGFGPLALEILDVGSRGVARLLDVAASHGARFLQASTSEVYGDPLVHPQPETYWGNVNPIGPRSVYDEGKRFAEALTMAYHRRHGLDVRVARIFNTYGPGMRIDDGRVISNFVTRAIRGEPLTVYGDGSQTRSLCYVDDLVTGLLALLDSDCADPVNLGSDDERTVLDVAQLVLELSGSTSGIVFTSRPVDDPEHALSRPHPGPGASSGWTPRTDLRDGLVRTIEWFNDRLGR